MDPCPRPIPDSQSALCLCSGGFRRLRASLLRSRISPDQIYSNLEAGPGEVLPQTLPQDHIRGAAQVTGLIPNITPLVHLRTITQVIQ